MGERWWFCSKYYHYWNSALGSQRGALFFFLPKSNIFYFVLSVPSSQTLWKKLKEEKSVSSGACLWKEIKILSKWNLKTARSQVAGKVVPPLTQGTTVQLSTEGTRNSRWTPQAQKKFSPFIWHRNKFFLFQVKGKKKKPIEVCPAMPGFFFSPNASKQCFDSKVPTAQTPPCSLCTRSTQTVCSDCKCQQIFIIAVQLFLSCWQHPASTTLPAFYHTLKRIFALCKR